VSSQHSGSKLKGLQSAELKDFQIINMLFTKFLLAAAAFTLASAQTVQFTNSNFSGIKVGVPFNITWSGASSGITLKLKNGLTTAQNFVMDIAGKLYTMF
jgi:hypothetical protein